MFDSSEGMMGPDCSPLSFLKQAVLLVVLGGVEFLLVALAVQGLVNDSVAPRIDPWDESRWVALADRVTSRAELEGIAGATAEEVVARLGLPTHVNRGWRLPDGCAQWYLYVQVMNGERSGTGVCISRAGRVVAVVGGNDSPPVGFDLRALAEEGVSARTLLLAIPAAVLAIPVAALIHLRRRLSRGRGLSIA